jgi:signal transduction histidine kinase
MVRLACGQAPGGRLRVEVADTGPGIPPDEIERLFVPFERLGGDPTSVEGTGLGLPLSQRLAEAMGSSLDLASTVGQGTAFWVELPQAPAPVDHGQDLAPSPQQDQATGLS